MYKRNWKLQKFTALILILIHSNRFTHFYFLNFKSYNFSLGFILFQTLCSYQSLPVSNSESVCEYYEKKRGNFDFILIWKFQVHVKVALQWKMCKSCYSLQYGRKPFTTIKNEKLGKETIGILSHPNMVSKIHWICQLHWHQWIIMYYFLFIHSLIKLTLHLAHSNTPIILFNMHESFIYSFSV